MSSSTRSFRRSCCCLCCFCRHALCMRLVEQPHDPLLLPCDALFFVCRDWGGRSDSAGECGRRRLSRQLTGIGLRAALARCEWSSSGSGSFATLLRCGRRAARVMLESRPFSPCRLALARQAAQAAARCMHSPDIHCERIVGCRQGIATQNNAQPTGALYEHSCCLDNTGHHMV